MLLCLNDRDERELPGGRLESDETPEMAVQREVLEETGLTVTADVLLRAWIFDPVPASPVLAASYGCSVRAGQLQASVEHAAVGFHSLDELAQMKVPSGYRTDIELWTRSR